MLKVIATVVRRAHLSHEELVKVWEGVHAPHVVKIAQPERYRITFFDPQQAVDDPGLDGMAELWFRDKRHFDTTIGRGRRLKSWMIALTSTPTSAKARGYPSPNMSMSTAPQHGTPPSSYIL